MKKILFLSFIVIFFCSCKHPQSDDTSSSLSQVSDFEIEELMSTISTSPNCHVSPIKTQILSDKTTIVYRFTVLTEENNLNSCISNIPKLLDTYQYSLSEEKNSYVPTFGLDRKENFQEFNCEPNKTYDRIYVLRNETDLWIETATSLTCSSYGSDNSGWYTSATDKSVGHYRHYKKNN